MRELTKIYFAAAVRTDVELATFRARVRGLEVLGEVAADQALLRQSHLFIGDFSAPSTDGGFLAARAVERRLPVLALFREGQAPSAALAGCADVVTRFFSDDASFFREARAFIAEHTPVTRLRAPRVFLVGPAGELGAALSQTLGAPHVSTGALLQELVARRGGHPMEERLSGLMKADQLVPGKLMRDLVLERLSEADCLKFGFILDGYPTSRDEVANLTAADVWPDLVVMLERGGADASGPVRAEWFPRSVVMRVDATRPTSALHDRRRHRAPARHPAALRIILLHPALPRHRRPLEARALSLRPPKLRAGA